MLGKMVKELKEEKNRVDDVKQPVKTAYCPRPVDPRESMPMVRDINREMNWYFQHNYPYPKNIGSFF